MNCPPVRPIIGITLGDAAGISPEIVVKTLADKEVHQCCRPIVVGDVRIVRHALRFSPRPMQTVAVASVHEAQFADDVISVVDLANLAPESVQPGVVSRAAGHAFVEYIRKAASLALAGEIDAIASAPTNKEAMNLAGHHYAGQTEVFAEVCGTTDYFTVLTGGTLKVFLLSSHVSLAEAIRLVQQPRVENVIRVARRAMQDLWCIEQPRIAVAGLNPHAGDSGLFGREEIEHVSPVISRLRSQGIDVHGPYPADSLYHNAESGFCDAVVGMYHDQGVIPLKKYGYVTVIAGTPIIRTTAGHGTAYNIAGQGIADASVMKRAVLLAAELADVRRQRAAKC